MKMQSMFAAALLVLALLTSCESSEDDTNTSANQVNTTELRSTAQAGQWQITYFFDTDSDETADFAGYVFTFASDGTVIAEKDGTQVPGSWSVTDDSDDLTDDSPDDDSDDVDFNLSFVSPASFAELTDDWDILEYSDTRIKLIDVSGGNGGTDYLTFEKI